MKTLAIVLLAAVTVIGVAAESKRPTTKPDFFAYNSDGSVKLHGVYQTDTQGRVSRYTVYDGTGRLSFVEIPYYASDGRIIRADHLDADGRLEFLVVYYDSFSVQLDASGKVTDKGEFSQKQFLDSQPRG